MNFKDYNQSQLFLFPPTFEDLIPESHPVRVVNDIIEKIKIEPLLKAYKKEGNPSYHPKMMLKIMVFAYMENTYSSRRIEKLVRENVNFMWLSGMKMVDHNTIARFRSQRLQDAFKDIFRQVVLLLADEGLVSLKEMYTDGTKIEAQAGKYTFVWKKIYRNQQSKDAPAAGRTLDLRAKHCRIRGQGSRAAGVYQNQQRENPRNRGKYRQKAQRQRYPGQEGESKSQSQTSLY